MRIMIHGYCWRSMKNGAVYDIKGISPCIVCGQHSGVEPKILQIEYESETEDSTGD